MAFPGNFNFNYYKGDTYEFKIYPKDSSGAIFDLSDYDADFTIANTRGSAATEFISCSAEISPDLQYITCFIDPSEGNLLNAGTTYVYDVEISKSVTVGETTRDFIYTLITGNITVTEQVTGAI